MSNKERENAIKEVTMSFQIILSLLVPLLINTFHIEVIKLFFVLFLANKYKFNLLCKHTSMLFVEKKCCNTSINESVLKRS